MGVCWGFCRIPYSSTKTKLEVNTSHVYLLRLYQCLTALCFTFNWTPLSFHIFFIVPDSAKPSPAPLPPANPSATNPSVPSTSSSGANGKRVSSSTQQQQSAVQRYPPREVPPRFRQHEHKQLLKRGQPLPGGSLPVVLPSSTSPTVQSFPSQSHPGQQPVQYTRPSFWKSS